MPLLLQGPSADAAAEAKAGASLLQSADLFYPPPRLVFPLGTNFKELLRRRNPDLLAVVDARLLWQEHGSSCQALKNAISRWFVGVNADAPDAESTRLWITLLRNRLSLDCCAFVDRRLWPTKNWNRDVLLADLKRLEAGSREQILPVGTTVRLYQQLGFLSVVVMVEELFPWNYALHYQIPSGEVVSRLGEFEREPRPHLAVLPWQEAEQASLVHASLATTRISGYDVQFVFSADRLRIQTNLDTGDPVLAASHVRRLCMEGVMVPVSIPGTREGALRLLENVGTKRRDPSYPKSQHQSVLQLLLQRHLMNLDTLTPQHPKLVHMGGRGYHHPWVQYRNAFRMVHTDALAIFVCHSDESEDLRAWLERADQSEATAPISDLIFLLGSSYGIVRRNGRLWVTLPFDPAPTAADWHRAMESELYLDNDDTVWAPRVLCRLLFFASHVLLAPVAYGAAWRAFGDRVRKLAQSLPTDLADGFLKQHMLKLEHCARSLCDALIVPTAPRLLEFVA